MEYTLLYKSNMLVASNPIPLYQNETSGNVFKFIFDLDCMTGFTQSGVQCFFNYKLPGSNIFENVVITLDADLYKDHYLVGKLPITNTFTKLEGNLGAYVVMKEEDLLLGTERTLVSNTINIRIGRSDYPNESSETDKKIKELQQKVAMLANCKAEEFEVINGVVYVYSDSTKKKLISQFTLPEEVDFVEVDEV